MIITNDFKLLAAVIKNSILGVSWIINPPLYIELINENCISSCKVHTPGTRRKSNVDKTFRRRLQEDF